MLLACASVACAQGRPVLIGAPDFPPIAVTPAGGLVEDYGEVSLSLRQGDTPAGDPQQTVEYTPGPRVVTRCAAGPIELTTTAYRAELWPGGVDVMEAAVSTNSTEQAAVDLLLRCPEALSWGDREGSAGGRLVARLPQGVVPVRKARDWGCATGASRLPGWGRPSKPCDPAFTNIRAGLGGIPIVYELKVLPGSEHQVVLGVCESHWATAGNRPVTYYVEGATREVVDPIAEWGQHIPGCLYFNARDKNGDGMLEVVAAPGPDAPDRNPILNVIWVFSPNEFVDTEDVIGGAKNQSTEYYIDCGGSPDQDLYEGGDLTFPVTLGPNERRELVLLFARPGASLPGIQSAPLPVGELRAAARDPWEDYEADLPDVAKTSPEVLASVAFLAMSQAQSDGYFVALPEPGSGLERYTPARQAGVALALDRLGLRWPAERLLRILWDAPAPARFAAMSMSEDGQWPDPVGLTDSQGLALYALARHAILTGDKEWAGRSWSAIAKSAGAMVSRIAKGDELTAIDWNALWEVSRARELAGKDVPGLADALKEAPMISVISSASLPGKCNASQCSRDILSWCENNGG
jgi:hypothetical protein